MIVKCFVSLLKLIINTMQLITDKKKEKKERIAKIQAEFKFLIESDRESQRTPIYKYLAEKHNIAEKTIFTYCKNICK